MLDVDFTLVKGQLRDGIVLLDALREQLRLLVVEIDTG